MQSASSPALLSLNCRFLLHPQALGIFWKGQSSSLAQCMSASLVYFALSLVFTVLIPLYVCMLPEDTIRPDNVLGDRIQSG